MIHDDLAQLRQLLARAVEASGRPRRELEREIGVGSGSLARVLAGDLDLTALHLTNLARLLRIPPGELLAAGCPEANATARHRLTDWLGPAGSTQPARRAARPALAGRAGGDGPRRRPGGSSRRARGGDGSGSLGRGVLGTVPRVFLKDRVALEQQRFGLAETTLEGEAAPEDALGVCGAPAACRGRAEERQGLARQGFRLPALPRGGEHRRRR